MSVTELEPNDADYIAGLISDHTFIEFLAGLGKAVVAWLLASNLGVPRFIRSNDAITLNDSNIHPSTFAYATTALRLVNANQTHDINYTARTTLLIRIKRWLETRTFIEERVEREN